MQVFTFAAGKARAVGTALLIAMALFLSRPSQLSAQEVAALTGVVTDASGAVVVGADVKLVDTKTNTRYETHTNASGSYTFAQLLPGPAYTLTVTMQGFQTGTVSGIYVAVNTTHTQDVQLNIGNASVTVEVNAAGENVTLNTTDTTVGNNFDMQLVHELPVAIRDNPTALLVYEPGVVATSVANDPNGNRSGAVTGARADQGSYTLDGLDVNDYAIGQSFIAVGNAPVDSIQEFRGETANPLSSEGRGSGAQVALVTKSGSNSFHGSASEYHRNTVTEANDWFNNFNGVPRPVLIRNQFGASIGGPVVKNKLFFFFDYEGRRDASQAPVEWTVPLDSYRNGLLSYINNGAGCSPASRQETQPACITSLTAAQVQAINPSTNMTLNSALLSYINGRYPHANDLSNPAFGDGVNTGGFRTNLPVHDSPNIYVTRIDYNLNDKMKLFGRFTIDREIQGDNFNFPAPSVFPGDPVARVAQNHNYAYVIGHTWTINGNMINQFSYGLTRQKFATPSLFNPLGNTAYMNAAGGSDFGIISSPYLNQSAQDRHVSVPVFRDDFTYVRGTHTFEFGGTFKPISILSSLGNSLINPTIGIGGNLPSLDATLRPSNILNASSVLTLWDQALPFAMGRYASVNTNYNYDRALNPFPVGTPSVRDYKAKETEVYLQDAWKARKDLTITYGLRYSYYSVPYETNGLQANSNLGFSQYLNPRVQAGLQGTGACGAPFPDCPATGVAPGNPLIVYTLGGKANHAPGYYHPDWRDFAPRFGVAYNPSFTNGFLGKLMGDRKTVVRAGAGIVYDHPALQSTQFLQNQVAAVFTSSAAALYPLQTGLTKAQALAAGPFFSTIGEVPAGLPPAPSVTLPVSPFTDFVGEGIVQNTLNFAFDPNFKTPYAELVTFGIERELPDKFQLDATFFGRFGRRLSAQTDAGQLLDFKDPASGQLMSQAFTAMERQFRTTGTVADQPFFNDLVPTIPSLGSSGTQLVANVLGDPFLQRGDMGTIIFVLEANGLLPFGIGFNPQYPYDIYVANQSASNYDGLLTTLHKKYSQGLQFDLNYTFSHSIDNLSAIANNVFGQGANFSGGILCDALNPRACRGNSDFDITHIISADGIYDLPFGRGKHFGGNASGVLNQIIGGWQISGDTQWHTGIAFTTLSNSFPISFNNDVPAIFNGNTSAVRTHVHTTANGVQLFADPTAAINAFGPPTGFQAGSRNNLRGPRFSMTDLSLNKHFPINERYALEFRAEAFNVFNHPNFALPAGAQGRFGGTADITDPSTFGFISSTETIPGSSNGARFMQFALRFDF